MGRLQAEGIRPLAHRARLARVDVVSGRQAADRRCDSEDGPEELGDTGASGESDRESGGVQDIFDVSLFGFSFCFFFGWVVEGYDGEERVGGEWSVGLRCRARRHG